MMGVSKERVRQIEVRAKDKMGRAAVREMISPFDECHVSG